jgi:hypothetical protein
MSDLAVVLLLVPAGLCGVATRSLAVYLIVAAASAAMTCAVPGLIPVLHRLFGSVPMRPPRREAITALLRVEVLSPIYWLSLLRVACLTAITLVIHFATGAVTVSAVVIAIPLVTVAISLAMMPGGFGVSEWSFSAVFTAMGIGHQQIVTFVLGNRILLSGSALFLMLLTATVVSAAVQPRKAKRPVRA